MTGAPGKVWQAADRIITARRLGVVRSYLHGDVLDVGCGDARIVGYFPPGSVQTYVGVDTNARLIESLNSRFVAEQGRFRFVESDCEQGSLPTDRQFDAILMLAFLEHLKNADNVLSQCLELLKSDGHLVITTPTVAGDRVLRALIAVLAPLHRGVSDSPHLFIWSRTTLTSKLETLGFLVESYSRFELGANQMVVARRAR